MKLVIAAEIFPPDIGGPATYSKVLAEQLSQQGWQVKLICYSIKIENDKYPFTVTRILRGQSTLSRYWQYFWHLLKLADRDCDLIYAMGPLSSGLPAIIVGFLLSKKVVVKVTGDYAWEQARNLGSTEIGIDEFQKQNLSGKIGWLKKIEKFVCQKAAKVIVPSQYLKKIVSGWEVKENKIEVIYNAFEPKLTDLPKDKDLIISIGRLVPWKGFDTLINLMLELLEKNPNFRLEIYGSGPQKETLEKSITNLNLKNKTIIKDISHDELMLKLTNAEIFVLNTGYEGLSHTILEAMAAGTPVITTNIGGNPELIKDGENGLLVEYNNKEQLKQAILKLHGSSELRQKFVENSKEVLKKFTLAEMINKTAAVLQKITNKK